MKLFTSIRLGVVATAIALVVTACGGPSSSSASSDFTKVNIAVTNNLVGVPIFVAAERGLFAKQGLDVQLKVVASGSDAARALQAGDVDFALSSTVSIAAIRSGGVEASILAMTSGDATSASYDLGNGIVGNSAKGISKNDPRSLKGKTIATNVGGSPEQYLVRYLKAHGLTEKDVKILNTPVPETVTALQQGLVDAIATVEPHLTRAQDALGGNAVMVSVNEGYTTAGVGLIGLAKNLDAQSETTTKVITAIAEASQMARKSHDDAVGSALAYVDGLDKDVAVRSFARAITDPRISVCTEKVVADGVNDALKAGQIKAEVDPSTILSTKWIEAVQKSSPQYFDDLAPEPTDVKECK